MKRDHRRTGRTSVQLSEITGLFAAVAAVLLPGVATALTTPLPGAVAKPAGFDISWPFQAGDQALITAGYGPNAGSSLHSGLDNTSSANDYYALDLVMPDYPDNGLGQPVLSMASGTVVKAGWATAGWANYGQRVIIEHDFNDGHVYITHYAHLNVITVSEGQHVNKGDMIGELGDSCDGDNQQLSCPWFGPHLHFAMHRDSYIGGSGTGGSYGGNAVVMEPMDGDEDLVPGMYVVSDNTGGPAPPCYEIPPQETILEDDGPCFSRRGPSQYWHDENAGHGNHCVWTYTIADPQPDNYAYWNLYFQQAGEYDLWAYIPSPYGDSAQARYTVRHSGVETPVILSQASSPDTWLTLGRFDFAQGGDQWIKLEDNTGEPYDGVTQIAFDAVRIAPAQGCECTASDPAQTQPCPLCGTQTRTCDGCNWPDWSEVQCLDQGECEAGLSEQDPTGCETGTARIRECSGTCEWGAWSECQEPQLDGGVTDPDGGHGNDPGASGGCSCRAGRLAGSTAPFPVALALVVGLLAFLAGRFRRR